MKKERGESSGEDAGVIIVDPEDSLRKERRPKEGSIRRDAFKSIVHVVLETIHKARTAIGNAITGVARSVREEGIWDTSVDAVAAVVAPFLEMVFETEIMEKRVCTFYAGIGEDSDDNGEIIPTMIVASGIAALFGAIHCAAWSFAFPSHTEQLLWRVSSIAITFLPLSIPLITGVTWLKDWLEHRESVADKVTFFVVKICLAVLAFLSFILGAFVYIVARVTLLVLALMSLRSLPTEAYQTVHWTTFIPHI